MNLPDFLTRDPDGYIHLTGHRIGLQHVIDLYHEGFTPETMPAHFDTVSVDLLNRVVDFYRANRAQVDAYLSHCRAEIERQAAQPSRGPSHAELRRRMEAVRRAKGA